eukprot:9585678-Prorocentrum_lima.AAC.1
MCSASGRIDQRLPLSVPSAEAAASLAEEATQSEHIADLDIQGAKCFRLPLTGGLLVYASCHRP